MKLKDMLKEKQVNQEQQPEQPAQTASAPETEAEKLENDTALLELKARHTQAVLNDRKATKLLSECQDCEATQKANQELANSLAEKEKDLTASALSLRDIEEKAKAQVETLAIREKAVATVEQMQKKADTFMLNFAKAQKADGVIADLLRIEKFIYGHQEHHALPLKETSEIAAIKRLISLFSEGAK